MRRDPLRPPLERPDLVDHNTSSSSGRNVRVTGDSDDNIVCEFGIALDSYSLQDGTVRGNVARGNTFGLALADYDNVLGAGAPGTRTTDPHSTAETTVDRPSW